MSHSRGRCRNRDSCCIGRHRASPSESPTAANHPREKSGPRSSSLFLPFWPPFPLNKSNDPRETWLRSSSVLRLVADITDVSASASQLSTLHRVQRIRRPLALTKALGLHADNGLV